jgi:hypothetical protein
MNKDEYRRYLRSAHWRDVKKRYRASKFPQSCFCGETRVDLHHRTYKRLGRERLSDLVPLCRKHHDEVHQRPAGSNLWKETKRVTRRGKKRRQREERARQSAAAKARVEKMATPPAEWF